jgi:hypothetical protein
VTRDSLAAQIWLAISCVDARRSTDISNGSGMAVARSARRSTAFLEQPICRGRNQTMQRFPRQTMRISFSTPGAARAAVAILEQYGFSAPAIERSIGLELVEGIEFSTGAPRNGAS